MAKSSLAHSGAAGVQCTHNKYWQSRFRGRRGYAIHLGIIRAGWAETSIALGGRKDRLFVFLNKKSRQPRKARARGHEAASELAPLRQPHSVTYPPRLGPPGAVISHIISVFTIALSPSAVTSSGSTQSSPPPSASCGVAGPGRT